MTLRLTRIRNVGRLPKLARLRVVVRFVSTSLKPGFRSGGLILSTSNSLFGRLHGRVEQKASGRSGPRYRRSSCPISADAERTLWPVAVRSGPLLFGSEVGRSKAWA